MNMALIPEKLLIIYIIYFPLYLFFTNSDVVVLIRNSILILFNVSAYLTFIFAKSLSIYEIRKFGIIIVFSILYTAYGISNGFEIQAIAEFRIFLSTVITIIDVFILYDNGFISIAKIRRAYFFFILVFVACDVICLYVVMGGLLPSALSFITNMVFNENNKLYYGRGFGNIIPQYGVDVFFFCIIYFMYATKKEYNFLLWLASMFVCVTAYSRWGLFTFAVTTIIIIWQQRANKTQTLQKIAYYLSILTYFGYPYVCFLLNFPSFVPYILLYY